MTTAEFSLMTWNRAEAATSPVVILLEDDFLTRQRRTATRGDSDLQSPGRLRHQYCLVGLYSDLDKPVMSLLP